MEASDFWLIVEDHPDEFLLFQRACRRAFGTMPNLHWAPDARAAKEFLVGTGRVPKLIVSDVRMPGMNGFEFLAWAHAQPSLHGVPFVIFSNSGLLEDRHRSAELGADRYWMKPSESTSYETIVRELKCLASSRDELERGRPSKTHKVQASLP